ncbi:MAG: hypothetical protein FJ088_08615 [Deltaproteobacteria bacterium]|nr:hypothetical protein [Deltaproteobacteria bacterium]
MKTLLFTLILLIIPGGGYSYAVERRGNGNFVFFYHPENEPKVAPLMENAQGYRARILEMLSLDDDSTIEVHVAADEEEMGAILGGGRVQEWVAGLAIASENRVILSAKGSSLFTIEDTFVHEIAHIYLAKKAGKGGLPRWFNEGFAMLLAGEPVIDRLKTALRAAIFKNLIRLEELEKSFPAGEPNVHLAYAESLIFMKFLISKYSMGKIVKIIGETDGVGFRAAFKKTTGDEIDDVEREWLDELEKPSLIFNIFSDWSVLWAGITVLFIIAYAIKKTRAKKKVRMWEIQEELETIRRNQRDDLIN